MSHFTNHTATITLDMGNHRQIQCAIKGQSEYHFEVTTWQNYLAITGDMGAFVFSRIPDMFEFFRTPHIDFGYWASKLVAQDPHSGATQYSPALFQAAVKERIKDFIDGSTLTKTQIKELRVDVQNEVILNSETIQSAVHAALNFEFYDCRPLQSITEADLEDYSPRYKWCCEAIHWAIKQYDKAKNNQITLKIGEREYKCLNLEEASKKYQYLRDLSMKSIEEFPVGRLSNGFVVSYSGSIWNDTALVMGAAKIEY